LSITIELDLDTARPMARAIQSRLAKLGIDVSLGQAYEVLAAAGEPEWNVLSAKMKTAAGMPTRAEPPISACVIIDLIGPSDPAKYAKQGITPAMLIEAAETFATRYYGRDNNPTAEVVQENFQDYMERLIHDDRVDAQPSWAEEWRSARSQGVPRR